MRAAYYERTGPAAEVLQIGDIPCPDPGPGEVCVRVHASGVNPSDVKKRMGLMPAPAAFPRIVPHSDGAGIVTGVGPGVPDARIGERVWLWNAQWQRPFGTAAEMCVLPADQAVPLPDGVDFAAGACLGIPAQTAWAAVMDGAPADGKTVLVHGGAGAVGEMAVAIAAQSGTRVIATVSSDQKAKIARAAGAEAALNRHTDAVADAVLDLTSGTGVDHIVDVDFAANWSTNAAVIAVNGSIAAYSAPSAPKFQLDYYAFAARAARLRFVQVYLLAHKERRSAIEGLTTLLAHRALPVRISQTLALDSIVQAHETQENQNNVGNIVLEP